MTQSFWAIGDSTSQIFENLANEPKIEKFEMNTHFDHDYFWETINYSLSDMFMCILKQG